MCYFSLYLSYIFFLVEGYKSIFAEPTGVEDQWCHMSASPPHHIISSVVFQLEPVLLTVLYERATAVSVFVLSLFH